MKLNKSGLCLAATTCLLQLFPTAGLASGDSEYDAGLKSYKAKDYSAATAHFGQAIKQGKQSASLWLYSGNSFAAMGHYQQALKSYEVVTNSFKGTAEAVTAAKAIEQTNSKLEISSAGSQPASLAIPPGATGLAARVTIVPPAMAHPAVCQASIDAVRAAIAALPRGMRKLLDDTGAAVVIAPNMIDRWPDSLKDLKKDEKDPAPTLAEQPGRIYGKDMCVYERAKVRGSTNLKSAYTPRFIKHEILNMCFQLIDDQKGTSKSAALRKEYEEDKKNVPPSVSSRLYTFIKPDDWGPRETCAELTGAMLGGGDENTELLYRYFPRTKKWLAANVLI